MKWKGILVVGLSRGVKFLWIHITFLRPTYPSSSTWLKWSLLVFHCDPAPCTVFCLKTGYLDQLWPKADHYKWSTSDKLRPQTKSSHMTGMGDGASERVKGAGNARQTVFEMTLHPSQLMQEVKAKKWLNEKITAKTVRMVR